MGLIRSIFNLAEQNLRDPHLADYIVASCQRLNVAPQQVKFEVTEQALIRDIQAAREIMSTLGQHGFRFAIDDFGIGYSNMLTLSRLPFHTLKIDRSFTKDVTGNPETRTIAAAMIKLGQALNLDVVVEGVETNEQARIMRELGGHMAQGYLYERSGTLASLDLQGHAKCSLQKAPSRT